MKSIGNYSSLFNLLPPPPPHHTQKMLPCQDFLGGGQLSKTLKVCISAGADTNILVNCVRSDHLGSSCGRTLTHQTQFQVQIFTQILFSTVQEVPFIFDLHLRNLSNLQLKSNDIVFANKQLCIYLFIFRNYNFVLF